MGGEAHVLGISSGFELLQSFKDHQKQATGGRFAPGGGHFVTISRDHSANVYARHWLQDLHGFDMFLNALERWLKKRPNWSNEILQKDQVNAVEHCMFPSNS